jgi:Mn-containing catalase
MFLRVDKLQFELPAPEEANPNAASTVQELLGGKFGEMSTLMNYMYQSFNFRNREALKPFYDLVANITAEELGHVELVSATINALFAGPNPVEQEAPVDPSSSPLFDFQNVRQTQHFIAGGPGAMAQDTRGIPWTGDNVFSSGNLTLDLLHNFFLESGARQHKLRVYEMNTDPVAKALCGYLLIRGGVHQIAYAKALEKLTGVAVEKMLPVPDIRTDLIPECKALMDQGIHRALYRFSPDDYKDMGEIWNGTHPDDGSEVFVTDDLPVGGKAPDGGHNSATFAPFYDMGNVRFEAGEVEEIAKKMHRKSGNKI